MLSSQDERLIVGYIMGALDEDEERSTLQRLAQDESFCRNYKRVLRSLRPILSARNVEEDETQVRAECGGLMERTMLFLRQAVVSGGEVSQECSAQMTETRVDTHVETKISGRKREMVVDLTSVSELCEK